MGERAIRAVTGNVNRVILAVEILARQEPLFRNEVANIVGDVELVAVCRDGCLGNDFRRLFDCFQPAEGVERFAC